MQTSKGTELVAVRDQQLKSKKAHHMTPQYRWFSNISAKGSPVMAPQAYSPVRSISSVYKFQGSEKLSPNTRVQEF